MSFNDFADTSQEDEKIFADVAYTFERWMIDLLMMKESSAKTYVKGIKSLVLEDGKTYSAMVSPAYFEAVKNSKIIKRDKHRPTALRKFTEFWGATGEKMWREKSGWQKAPPDKRVYFLEAPPGLGRPDGEGTFANARRSAANGSASAAPAPAAPAAPAPEPARATVKNTPASQPAAAAATTSKASKASQPAAPESAASKADLAVASADKSAEPGEWPEASQEDKDEMKDLMVKFKDWMQKSNNNSDEVASNAIKEFKKVFNKHLKPLRVMGGQEFVKWLQASKTKPGTMQLNSVRWFGRFWVEGLGRKLEGTLCDVGDSQPPAQAEEADSFLSSLTAGMEASSRGSKRKRDEHRQSREAKRRREAEDLAAQPAEDPPEIASDTEYPVGDVEPFPEVVCVEGSGNSKLDGAYKRYRSFSRGRPCYIKSGKKDMYMYWNRAWRIGKNFGDKQSIANVKDFQEPKTQNPCFPLEPYPNSWKVFPQKTDEQKSADGSGADVKQKAVLVSQMRVYDTGDEDVQYTKGALLMRQPVLREPFGISKKHEAGGSSSSKPSKSSHESGDKAPSPKKPAKVDADTGGKPEEKTDTKHGPDSESEEAADEASASSAESSASSSSESENEDPKKDDSVAGTGPAEGAKKVEDSSEVKFRRLMDGQLAQVTSKDEVVKVLSRLLSRSRDENSYASLAAQLKISDIPRERFVAIMGEIETQHGITQELKDKWLKGTRPAVKTEDKASKVTAEVESAPTTRHKPPNHRQAPVPPSCLKSKRIRSNMAVKQRITYKDGISGGDEKGPELEDRLVVVSHRLVSDLWFQQPGSQVTCDRCLRIWPQTMGMLAGSPGMSQFAQNQWWCTECAQMGYG